MSQIDQHGQATLDKMEDAIQLEDDIDDLSIVLGTLKTSVTALTILPVVGGAMSTLITTLQAGAVDKMKKSIKSFNRAVVDNIKPITEELLQKNAALAEKIAIAKFIVYEYVSNDHCQCHDSVTAHFATIADRLDRFVETVTDIAIFYKELDHCVECDR